MFYYLAFQSFDFERTWWSLLQKCIMRTKFDIYVFIIYHWVDTSAGGPLVSEAIIRLIVSASARTWFIRYIYYWNLQFLSNAIINKTKVLLQQVGIDELNRCWLYCLGPLVLLLPPFLIIWFPIFRFWAYLMKVIPETCHAYYVLILPLLNVILSMLWFEALPKHRKNKLQMV
jgi:hypothetical protein